MKKSLIALAVAAALPVAAQADTTLSGSVTYVHDNKGANDTDAVLTLLTEERLANDWIAGVNIDLIGSNSSNRWYTEGNLGTAFLKGNFFGVDNEGEAKFGFIDSDGSFQLGDPGGVVGETSFSDDSETGVYGMSYSSGELSNFLNLSFALQVNSGDGPGAGDLSSVSIEDANYVDDKNNYPQRKSTQFGFSLKPMPGLTIGAAMATDDADNGVDPTKDKVDGDYPTVSNGVNEETHVFGGKYETGPFSFTLGKQEDIGAKGTVKYTHDEGMYKGAYVKLEHDDSYTKDDKHTDERSQITVGYGEDGDDGWVASAKREWLAAANDNGDDKVWEASIAYKTGFYKVDNLTTTAKRKKDKDREYTLAWDMGNADLTLKHTDENNSDEDSTTLTYKVSF